MRAKDSWQPDADAVGAQHEAKLNNGQQQNTTVFQRAKEILLLLFAMFTGQHLLQGFTLFGGQPMGFRRFVTQFVQHHQANERCRQPLDDEHPLPAMQPTDVLHSQQQSRERSADDRRNRNTHHEPGKDSSAVLRREPACQVKGYAREETRFSNTQDKACQVEGIRTNHEGCSGRSQTPGDHDSSQPATRTVAIERHVAWHFQQTVARKENARAPAELGGSHTKISVHGQRSKANTGTVDVVENEGENQQRENLPGTLVDRAALDF
ncbi:hypothetical protein D3C76_870640 [compost metagenome]